MEIQIAVARADLFLTQYGEKILVMIFLIAAVFLAIVFCDRRK